MPTAIIGAVGSIAGGLIASKGSKDAAQAQTQSIDTATQLSEASAEQARQDVLEQFDPSLKSFLSALDKSSAELKSGKLEIFDILKSSTGDANRILMDTGKAITSALLGNNITSPGYYDSNGKYVPGATTNTAGQTGFAGASKALTDSRDASMGLLNPYIETGEAALNKEAGLSGALGAEAQQTAIDDFIESPGQKYLREKQEQSLLRNSAAIGGLGSGGVLTALQEQAMQIAATDQQRTLENYRSLATRGQDATGLGVEVNQTTGANLSNLASNTGNALATAQQNIGTALSGNAQTLGTNLSEIAKGTTTGVANNYTAAGTGEADLRMQLATLLANLGVKQGTNASSLALAQGDVNAASALGQSNALQSTVSNLAGVAGNYYGNQQTTQQPQYKSYYDPKSY